jgi:hypothetical protein
VPVSRAVHHNQVDRRCARWKAIGFVSQTLGWPSAAGLGVYGRCGDHGSETSSGYMPRHGSFLTKVVVVALACYGNITCSDVVKASAGHWFFLHDGRHASASDRRASSSENLIKDSSRKCRTSGKLPLTLSSSLTEPGLQSLSLNVGFSQLECKLHMQDNTSAADLQRCH